MASVADLATPPQAPFMPLPYWRPRCTVIACLAP